MLDGGSDIMFHNHILGKLPVWRGEDDLVWSGDPVNVKMKREGKRRTYENREHPEETVM